MHTSSGAIYGYVDSSKLTHIPESYMGAPNPLDPKSAYGEGKRISELIGTVFSYKTGIRFVNARCFAFAGPYLPINTSFAIGNFIRDKIEGKNIQIKDGSPRRSYLYAADLVVWLIKILICGKTTVSYNVGSDKSVTIAELADMVEAIYENKHFTSSDCRSLGHCYVPSIDLAKKDLGLRVYTDLETSIKKMIAWNNSQRAIN